MTRILSLSQTLVEDAPEPVTLQQFKDYAKHEWAGSTAWEIVENSLDTLLIKAAREIVEGHIRQNIVKKDVTCTIRVSDEFAVPMGEVIGDITVTDNDDNEVTGFTTYGTANKTICGLAGVFKLSYQSGMAVVPESVATAIKAQALFMYDNRLSGEVAPMAKAYLMGHINYDHY